MPIRCKSIALQQSLGTINIQNMIRQRQLTFIQSFSRLPQNSLPWQILDSWLSSASSQRSVISTWRSLSESLHLPPIQTILNGHLSKAQWKNQVKHTIHSAVFSSFADDCDHIPLTDYLPSRMGKPSTLVSNHRNPQPHQEKHLKAKTPSKLLWTRSRCLPFPISHLHVECLQTLQVRARGC